MHQRSLAPVAKDAAFLFQVKRRNKPAQCDRKWGAKRKENIWEMTQIKGRVFNRSQVSLGVIWQSFQTRTKKDSPQRREAIPIFVTSPPFEKDNFKKDMAWEGISEASGENGEFLPYASGGRLASAALVPV